MLHPTHMDKKTQEDHRDSIRKTVCSMANTNGRFILFGVRDRKQDVTTLEDRLIGIPLHGELVKEFGQKIDVIQPAIYFTHIPHALLGNNRANRGIFVVSIPKSQRRPHMISSTGIYYRRGENGTAIHMYHYEVRDQMMYTEERLQKVNLLRLEMAQYLEIVEDMRIEDVFAIKSLPPFRYRKLSTPTS